MLEALTDYLRVSLGSLRHADSTLGVELDLATRYLQLMQARMGERLRFEVEADADARAVVLSSLLLQPLVENAVKHGLEPQVDGGTVRVTAHRIRHAGADALQVCVDDDDDGAGLAASAARTRRTVAGGPDGHGIALDNLRERLRTQFGAAASLELTELPAPGGTRCCLVVPWRGATPA
jgi:sensor histidine kinase YesM